MHGEPIEVPKVEEEPVVEPGDTIQWTPGIDSLLDSLRAPVETLPPSPELAGDSTAGSPPVDSTPAVPAPPDSGAPVRSDSSH